ncbi:MAG: PIN domain protein, partial [Bacteroidota bacterium]
DRIPDECLESIGANKEAVKLAKNYVKEGALTDKFEDDAIHIALATVHRVDVLASWNFKHMVSFFRIRQYNAVNLKYGYATIDIRSPKEILL